MSEVIELTKDQNATFIRVKGFFEDHENPAIVIIGSAGTGKTTLLRYIVDHITDNGIGSIVAVAPTHKARRVLEKILNTDRFLPVPSLTVAAILGKIRDHHYIGSHRYTNGSKQKMDRYNYFILDEVSMVGDKDLEEIIEYICHNDKKLILVGDHCQIPSPSQELVRDGDMCYKPDSVAFDIENICELRSIVRQAEGSIIIQIASYLRDHLNIEVSIRDILTDLGVEDHSVFVTIEEAHSEFIQDREQGLDPRMIAYTNAAVRSHNDKIRTNLNIQDKSLVEGELLTGYDNVGWPTPVIENGTDYKVTVIQPTTKHIIHGYAGLTGNIVDLCDIVDPSNISRNLFFIDVKHSSNNMFMREFVKRAEKVNKRHSTRDAYRKYCQLKNRAVFLEDVYKYAGKIMTNTDFRQSHPLLFTKVSEVIDTQRRSIAISELTKKIGDQYGEIAEGRLLDNKPFADGELFADQYMVVEKDISYGYALTAHKSQGSTYDSVFVDENDFQKISNKWNYRLRAVEHRFKERNQLKYVAYTRAAKKLKVMI